MDLQQLEAIAQKELAKQGLTGWSFGWARTKRRLGACNFRQKRIEIAEYYARHNPPEKVLDTLLHEIAHALAGPKARHGPIWKAIAMKLGARPRACDSCDETVTTPGDWQASCDSCGRTWHKYKRPQTLTGYRCGCVARRPLTFQYVGDATRPPEVPLTLEQAAKWEATCDGCRRLHLRIRKPGAGLWICRCPHRCELVWNRRQPGENRSPSGKEN